MADQRTTDLDPIESITGDGMIDVVDVNDTSQDPAGSSFKISKDDFLKEVVADVLTNTAKVGITTNQAAAILLNTEKVGISTDQAAAILLNTAKVGITTGQAAAILLNTAKVGITTAQATAITDNTANTSKVSINNDVASLANVRSLRYREETYSSNLDMVMQSSVGVYSWVNVFTVAFNIVNSLVTRFKNRVATDGGTFESQTALESVLTSLGSLITLPSLILTANAVKASKLYSITPNTDLGDFTLTRNTTATRVNVNGIDELVGLNVPRLNYDSIGGVPSILLEDQRTNLILNSATLATQSITSTAVAHTLSFRGAGTVTLSGSFSGSLVGTGINNRVTLTFTPTAATLTLTISGSCTNGQIEVGAFATSYIPTTTTTTAAATRNQDLLSKSGIGDLIGQTEGSFFLNLSTNLQDFKVISLTDGTTVNRISFAFTNNILRIIVVYGGIIAQSIEYTSISSGIPIKAILKYTSLNFTLFVNGVNIGTQAKNTFTLPIIKIVNDQGNGGNVFNGKINGLQIYKTALSDAQCVTLTT